LQHTFPYGIIEARKQHRILAELEQSVGPKPLAGKSANMSSPTGIIEQPHRVRPDAARSIELSRGSRVQQRLVWHRPPEGVRQPARNLVGRQLERPVTLRFTELGAIKKVR